MHSKTRPLSQNSWQRLHLELLDTIHMRSPPGLDSPPEVTSSKLLTLTITHKR